ncbi:diguanylate phosphodiesterase [Pseudomonas putida]|nr:diguanylate phosphodiesterase [Pseudomonas putida]
MGGDWLAGPALSRVNPLLRRPAPNLRCVCRSGFTREYGGGGNGERWVEIG